MEHKLEFDKEAAKKTADRLLEELIIQRTSTSQIALTIGIAGFLRSFWREPGKIRKLLILIGLWKQPVEVKVEKLKRRKQESRAKDVEEAGRWFFKRDILDRLEDYFICIRRMKKYDKESYQIYSRLGAVVVSGKMAALARQKDSLLSIRGHKRIGFGAICLTYEQKDDKIPAKFLYFMKMEAPAPSVQPALGDIYAVTFFHTRSDNTMSAPNRYHVSVDPNGGVTLLKELRVVPQVIKPKTSIAKKASRCYGHTRVNHYVWNYPGLLVELCKENEQDLVETARKMFYYCYEGYVEASMDIRVRVSKRNVAAVFTVDMLRMPYFFDEREATYTDSGAKKRIFHIVRTHSRTLRSGKVVNVHSHFRGERSFIWHEYKVNITMPGKHHADLLQLDFGALDLEEPAPKGMLSIQQMARTIDKEVNV